MLNLDAKYLNIICPLLAQYVPDMTVWAYGSRVNGQAHESSDLDLVVINTLHPDKPQVELLALRQAFHDSHLPIRIDIHDWARLSEHFRAEIKQQYEVIRFY